MQEANRKPETLSFVESVFRIVDKYLSQTKKTERAR